MEQRPAIFKLNLDCFDHVFDYLSLGDLSQFGQTCKAMKAAVGQYYEMNYGTHKEYASVGKENLYLHRVTKGFSDFIQKLCTVPLESGTSVSDDAKRDLHKKVTEIQLQPNELTTFELSRLEYILNNAEILSVVCEFDEMSRTTYKLVPGMCNSLKRLHMREFECRNHAQIQDGNRWLLRDYPQLEHLEWTQTSVHGYKIREIKEFFQRNPNVRSFATNHNCLWESRHLIIASGVKLNDLTVEIYERDDYLDPEKIENTCFLLNELYEKGVYKRLHLNFKEYCSEHSEEQYIQKTIDQIVPLKAVRSVSLSRDNNVDLSKLMNLVELQITYSAAEIMPNVDMMANYLVNLERVDLGSADLTEMLSFISHSAKLKKLRVTEFRGGNVSVLNLVNMNKRREQLLDATKVTIFIEERVYLATKWASTLTDFRLIEMRRSSAHEWGHQFRIY